ELVSWLSNRLGWEVQGGQVTTGATEMELKWTCVAPKGETRIRIKRLPVGPPEIRRLRLACQLEGKPGALDMVVEQPDRLAVRLEGLETAPRTMTVPPRSPAEIVGRQLSDRDRDPVFSESMAVAQVLAQSVLS